MSSNKKMSSNNSNNNSEDKVNAVHEAGHVLVALYYKVEAKSVQIETQSLQLDKSVTDYYSKEEYEKYPAISAAGITAEEIDKNINLTFDEFIDIIFSPQKEYNFAFNYLFGNKKCDSKKMAIKCEDFEYYLSFLKSFFIINNHKCYLRKIQNELIKKRKLGKEEINNLCDCIIWKKEKTEEQIQKKQSKIKERVEKICNAANADDSICNNNIHTDLKTILESNRCIIDMKMLEEYLEKWGEDKTLVDQIFENLKKGKTTKNGKKRGKL